MSRIVFQRAPLQKVLYSWLACFCLCATALANKTGTPLKRNVVLSLRSPSELHSPDDTNLVKTVVSAQKQPFAEALQMQVKVGTPFRVCDCKIIATNTAPVAKGEKLLIEFYVKRKTNEVSSIKIFFSNLGRPGTTQRDSVNSLFYLVTDGWQKVQLAATARDDHPAGKAQLTLCFAQKPQTIQVGDVKVSTFGKDVALADVPQTRIYYPGHKLDAPWRKAAEERIEKYRKADLNISIRLKEGLPAADAGVYVKMKRHGFVFGTSVNSHMINEKSPDAQKYRDTLLKIFNKTVFEDELKWVNWERSTNQQAVFQAAEWLLTNNLPMRGHHLLSAGWARVPQRIQALERSPFVLRRRINERIVDMATAWKGKMAEWDVLNEPHLRREIINLLGRDVTAQWFKLAHETDPDARLYINDFGIFGHKIDQDIYEDHIQFLLSTNAPIHGIGIQGHYDNDPTPPEVIISDLDRFAKLGLPILISEHSVNSTDETFQANYTRDFMTAVFSHPAVVGMMFWGFWAGDHFKPSAAYFTDDWSVRPAGQVMMDLILQKWRTNGVGKTNRRGQYTFRGFMGEYEVMVHANGQTKILTVDLPKDGRTLEIRMD